MSKNKKKAKKSKDKVPSTSSEPVNNSVSDGESERLEAETSSMNKNKENITTSSEIPHTNELNVKPEPPEFNLQELSDMKNKCRALTSNLNTMTKKYEDEKKEKEKLYVENQYIKSKLSTAEKELQTLRMQLQQLKKENDHQKSLEYHEKMEVETTMDQVHEQPKQEASDGYTWEEKEDSLVESKAQGTYEESWSAGERDSEMTNSFNREESGLAQGNDQEKIGSCHKEDQKHWGEAAALDALTEAGHSIQPCAALEASGSDTRLLNRRGSDMGQKRNEWPQAQAPNRNEERHRPHNFHNERPNRADRNDHGQNYRRGVGNRGDRGHNNNHNVNNRDRQDHRMRTTDEPSVVTEIFGDLFTAPPDYSLAHCVAEDMRMGSGIAVTFKQKFKRVDELLDQRKRQGHVAVLEDEGRYIYYLVTKRESTGKPTMETLQRSLEDMCSHVIEKQVKKIAMPRIGCGLDRLEWRSVKPLIERIFSGTGAEITVYNYNETVPESSKPKTVSNVWLKNSYKPVAEIAEQTAILCLCAADGSVDSTFGLVDRRFKIMTSYQQMDRKLGDILCITKRDYLIFLLIVRETKSKPLSFMALGECIRKACKVIDKEKCYYVAVEAFDDMDDPLLFEKVITVIKTYLDTRYEKELWLCWPTTVSGKLNTRPNNET